MVDRAAIRRRLVDSIVWRTARPVRDLARRIDRRIDLAARSRTGPSVEMPVLVVGIYRRRNSAIVGSLVSSLPRSSQVRLWALDEPDHGLQQLTMGSGPGQKFELLDRLIAGQPSDRTLVVVDDDVSLTRGSISQLVQLMERGGIDIAQPAHDLDSHLTFPLLRARPRSVARLTSFVEIGPVFAFSAAARQELVPFGDVGMGWGLESWWEAVSRRLGLRMGVVDDVQVRHLNPVGVDYDKVGARTKATQFLTDRGIVDQSPAFRTYGRWRVGRRAPRWLR